MVITSMSIVITYTLVWVISRGVYLLSDSSNWPIRFIFDLQPLFAAFMKYLLLSTVVDLELLVFKCNNCILIWDKHLAYCLITNCTRLITQTKVGVCDKHRHRCDNHVFCQFCVCCEMHRTQRYSGYILGS